MKLHVSKNYKAAHCNFEIFPYFQPLRMVVFIAAKHIFADIFSGSASSVAYVDGKTYFYKKLHS